MERIANLFGQRRAPERKRRTTERSEIFDAILARVNPSRIREGYEPLNHKRLGFLLTSVPTKDCYALLSKMKDGERRGVPAGAIFWSELKAPKSNDV